MAARTWEEIKTDRGDPSETPEYLAERASLKLGRLVRGLRRRAEMTQSELAREMGVSQPEVARLESGASVPKIETLARVAKALHRQLVIETVARKGVAGFWHVRRPTQAGHIVRQLRVESGLSQAELAEKMGLAQPHVARIEAGDSIPMVGTLVRVANAVGQDLVVGMVTKQELEGGVGPTALLDFER
jgi:transcriptional regulator with XRE-family HTH domain